MPSVAHTVNLLAKTMANNFDLQLARAFTSDQGVGLPANKGRGRFDPFTSMTASDWMGEDISTVQTGNAPLITGLGCMPQESNRTIVQNGLLFITQGWEQIADEEYREPYMPRDAAAAHVFMLHSVNATLRELCAEAQIALKNQAGNRLGRGGETMTEFQINRDYVFNTEAMDSMTKADAAAIVYSTVEGVNHYMRYIGPNGAQSNFMASNTADQDARELSADSNGTMISPVSRGLTPVHNYWAGDAAESGQHLWLILKRSYLGTDEPEDGKLLDRHNDPAAWSAFQYVPYTSPGYKREVEPRVLRYLGYGGRMEFAKPVYVGVFSLTLVQAVVTEHMVNLAAGLHTPEVENPRQELTATRCHAAATSLNVLNLVVDPSPSADYALVFV